MTLLVTYASRSGSTAEIADSAAGRSPAPTDHDARHRRAGRCEVFIDAI